MQSYNNPFSPKSLLSPRPHRTSASSSRRSSILPGHKKLPTRYSVSGRSNQSAQVVCKTPFHIAESFGVPLPVLVTEALTFSDRSTAVSVSFSADGWAWFVCGRRLLIWQYKQPLEVNKQRHVVNSQCQELTLPPSDLAHKACLVAVFTGQGNVVPSCIAVSPEGTVRYWPSISHEGASVEDNADLQGQECDSLTNIAPVGCVLATTTSTILLLEPQITGGRHAITCRMLKMPHGWLGGLGRKVSSLIFGSIPTSQVMETKLVKIVAVGMGYESKEWCVFVLADHSLQKWILCPGEVERLVYESDINRMVREAFHETVWESCAGSTSELDIWMLDMQPTEGGVVLLVAAVNTQLSPQLHYALGKLTTDNTDAPTKFSTFCPLKNTGFYKEDNESELLGYQFLLVGQEVYLYNQKTVVAVSAVNYSDEPDIIEFMGSGDRLLGGALCGNVPVVFSKTHGLLSISPCDITPYDVLNSSVSLSDLPTASDVTLSQFSEGGVNITISEMELQELSINKDSVARMRAAFIHYIKNHKDLTQSEEIVRELFPRQEDPVNEVDAVLDTVIVRMSKELVNDTPASDPRWAEVKSSGGVNIGYTSLQILHQLEDKQKALDWYISFLKEVKLWDRFGAVTSHGVIMATSYILGEHAEKIMAAIALRKLQSDYGSIIDTTIKGVLAKQDISIIGGLSHQDIFYKEVNGVHRFFQVLSKWSEELVFSDRRPQEVVVMLAEANTVILSVLQDVIQFRQQKAAVFSPTSALNSAVCEYVPWTAAAGGGGLKDALALQQEITLKHGARSTGDIVLKNQLYDQLVNIVDISLDGRKCQLESIRGTKKFDGVLQVYEKERYDNIQPLLEDEEYERAAILAEKYCDFQILVQICELTENKGRLDQYMEKFADQNFSQFLFRWYIREQKQGRLLEQFRGPEKPRGQQQALAQFLDEHPSLSWLQNVFSGNYRQASLTLQNLAKEESELLSRKKSMLSLAKLALLASKENPSMPDEEVENLNSALDLILHQEDLPETVLSAFGYDVERLRVLTPVEIIKLFISDENQAATEFDFKKALDLLIYISDEFEISELKHTIWCQAILRDKWTETVLDSPVEVIQKTVFFKLVDYMIFLGGNPEEFLPSLERLLVSQELGALKDSSNFQYLLKVGYEHVQRTVQDLL